MSKPKLVWKKKPDPEDYEAARNFLSLLASGAKCAKLIRALEKADTIERAAKDLLRASKLPLLPRDDPHVDDDLQKIHKGKPLAPVLLVRGDPRGSPLIVADGYHRICAICFFDENSPIACRLVAA
jgi:hypothetical protein